MAKIQVTQIRSTIGRPKNQRLIIKGIGLRGINHTVELKDTPSARGMVKKVHHLVSVRVVAGEAEAFGRRANK